MSDESQDKVAQAEAILPEMDRKLSGLVEATKPGTPDAVREAINLLLDTMEHHGNSAGFDAAEKVKRTIEELTEELDDLRSMWEFTETELTDTEDVLSAERDAHEETKRKLAIADEGMTVAYMSGYEKGKDAERLAHEQTRKERNDLAKDAYNFVALMIRPKTDRAKILAWAREGE